MIFPIFSNTKTPHQGVQRSSSLSQRWSDPRRRQERLQMGSIQLFLQTSQSSLQELLCLRRRVGGATSDASDGGGLVVMYVNVC